MPKTENNPGDLGSSTLSRILGVDLPKSLSSCQPTFHAQPQNQDLPMPMHSPVTFSHQEGLSTLGVNHPDLMALPPGPSSAPSTFSNQNSCQCYIDPPGFHPSGNHLRGQSFNREMSKVSPLLLSPYPSPGLSSAASPTRSFNACQHYNTNLPLTASYQNPAHNSLISQLDTARPRLNCYQQASHNYIMDARTSLPQQRLDPSFMKSSKGTSTDQRPSVIQSRRKGVRSSLDDLKAFAPPATSVNQDIDIESQMTMRFIQEKLNSKKSRIPDPEAQRSSVIVSSPKPLHSMSALLNFEEIGCEERDTELPEVDFEEINVKEYPDLKALCMTYLVEESPNTKEMEKTFYEAWYNINLGEQVLGSFIQFLKTQGPLPTSFMVMSGLQYR